jgi:stearoyl-CoA desaturase (delta-9 desaturase)
MMLHRYYTHKSFELNSFLKYFFTLFAILAGRGSPLGWVYIHRIHHGFSDTNKDPHSPHFTTFKFIGFRPVQDPNKKINYFIIKDLMNPTQLKIDKYYLLIIFFCLLLLGMIDYSLVFYAWALPVFLVSITQTFFNYFAHMHGYRNFETNDKSTNNILLWPFILGDAWHNNHHHAANQLSTKIRSFEFDPVVSFINIISKKNV